MRKERASRARYCPAYLATRQPKDLKDLKTWLYSHFLPSSSSPAFCKSAGVIAIRNVTSARNVKNHGSARAGMFDASGMSTTITAPLWPSCSVKYTASGLMASRGDFPRDASVPLVVEAPGGSPLFQDSAKLGLAHHLIPRFG